MIIKIFKSWKDLRVLYSEKEIIKKVSTFILFLILKSILIGLAIGTLAAIGYTAFRLF